MYQDYSSFNAFFSIKLPPKRTKCCLRQSNFLKFSGGGYPQTPRDCNARLLFPTVRTRLPNAKSCSYGPVC